MADNDELQQSLDTLGRHVSALTRQMSKAGKQIDSLNRTVGDLVAQNKSQATKFSPDTPRGDNTDEFVTKVLTALDKYAGEGARTKQGTVNKSYLNQFRNRLEKDFIPKTEIIGKQISAYRAHNNNSSISSVVDVNEGTDAFNVFLGNIKDLMKKFDMSAADYKSFYEDIGVGSKHNKDKFNISDRIRPIYDDTGKLQTFEDISSDFAKLRDDVVALRSATGELSRTISGTSNELTIVNDNIKSLAENSKILNDIFITLNDSQKNYEKSINDMFTSITTWQTHTDQAYTNHVNQVNALTNRYNIALGNAIQAQQTLTAHVNNLMRQQQLQNSQQSQQGDNTFRRQTQKNDERSRQAGFIAMLIPALGKLLEKTVLTDSLKTAGLMIGGGMPEIGALIATLAPWIGGALMSKVGGSIVKKFTGRGAQNLTKNASKGGFFANIMGASKDMPLKQKGIWLNRWTRGFGRGLEGNTLHSSMSLDNRRALFAARYARAGEQAPVLSAEAYLQGRKARRNFSRRVGVYTKSIGKTGNRLYTGLTGVGGKGLSKIPFLTGALTIGEELLSGKFSEAHKREGRKGVLKQTGKTLAGATAAMGGAALGGKIGAAVGSIIPGAGTVAGGAIGAAIGLAISGVMVPLFKNTTDLLTNNVDATSDLSKLSREQWGKEVTELNAIQKVMTGISSIFVGFWRWLRSLKIFGGGKDYTPSGRAENIVKKESDRIDKELNSKKYKIGTWQYNNLLNKYKREYAEQKYDPSNPVVKGAQIEAYLNSPEAEKYAQQKIVNEIKSLRNKKASVNSAVGAIKLPENVVYDSENGITTVKMESMGLVGKISSGNSVPEIAAKNAENLKALDAILALGGSGFTYESAMGGKHKKSSKGRGHGDGAKVDVGGRILSPDEYDRLFRLGYFGNGTGAVGYEYKPGQTDTVTPEQYRKLYNSGQVSLAGNNHYDFTVSKGEGIAAYAKIKTETATDVEKATKVSTASLEASSEIREGLAKAIGEKKREDKTARARNIIFSAVDVTGSLGVWGITQINNTGRDAGRMRTGI